MYEKSFSPNILAFSNFIRIRIKMAKLYLFDSLFNSLFIDKIKSTTVCMSTYFWIGQIIN